MKVACIQSQIHNDLKSCYTEIETLVKKLLEQYKECDIICLPERWTPYQKDFENNVQNEKGQNYLFIKKLAQDYQINVISGALWEKRKDLKKPKITSYFIDKNGDEIGYQDKIHLYSYEREKFESGNELKLFNFKGHLFAILICFDMAFFETPRLATENGADILFSPTQIREEGLDNWNTYLKARALENRIPVVACNSVGTYYRRKYLGSSKIISFLKDYISPSKLNIIEGPIGSGYIYDDVDLLFPKKLRSIRLDEQINKSKIKVIIN